MPTAMIARLIAALIAVESAGDDFAVGDNGAAFGCLQIHQIMVDDVNRIAGTSFIHEDAFAKTKAVKMCEIYLTHYATPRRVGGMQWEEAAARMWNGGPRGHWRASTLSYWERVKVQLERNEQNEINSTIR